MTIRVLSAGVFALILFPLFGVAQELVPDTVVVSKARVVEIVSQKTLEIAGTDTEQLHQTIRAEILDGPEKGAVITVENDFLALAESDLFYLSHVTNEASGADYYAVSERYRLPALLGFLALFIAVTLAFGGKQGFRGLLALVLSFAFIFLFLLPGILAGYSPILVAMGVASLIVLIGSYVTHGVNRMTSAAVIGMVATVLLTGALAYIALYLTQFTGFYTDAAVYLNFNTRGAIDFSGLLMGGILIGILGVLYDAAIGQAVAVEELFAIGKGVSRFEVYKRALRIGREHIGALVNTLAIAYTGAALPLLLLMYNVGTNVSLALNSEVIAVEIIRILVGSIGIVLAVPLTTAISVWMLAGGRHNDSTAVMHKHAH
ncbi:hypothetical protein A2673_02625 [Candidatus Kaiserbacteria bacterium RIFCSPHIGHO2_01_FULL_50_13]|uniref:YibE/F family protein n=1 Tax=Candidatus Kaiserbacteria bacterium RIFCSPLOWO2_01_FULL_50_24 TaxID=1798507 RepID=A0A1F6ER90_9BACT|nr:MAG: hypothetical protein A2673_02625 [Candidatus Kaiserbacteria bacterium RIFCSPHIGHO2_01_FULL_50_13]OGG76130.1 MAG: hypothetical protein A3A34_00905 [Candidatus Kaiserbacteria bacterium RIFCSPLOWO2_01_FULL_50_24]OGG82339.1 MAG: hypothetical protein A3H74_00015 [Candidatus Kaiserbacteria bacterium RIFCSPLOWO2_02_FULL_51_13]